MILPLRTVRTFVISKFTSGPWPATRQMCLTATRSPAWMKSLIGSATSELQASRICSHSRMTASLPTNGPGSGQPSGCRMMASGSCRSRKASISPAVHSAGCHIGPTGHSPGPRSAPGEGRILVSTVDSLVGPTGFGADGDVRIDHLGKDHPNAAPERLGGAQHDFSDLLGQRLLLQSQ